MIARASLVLSIAAALSLQATAALGAKATVVLYNDGKLARPAETVVIPFAEVKKALPDLIFDQVMVRDDQGAIVPSQVTAMKHVHKGPAEYDDLIFQRDFPQHHVDRSHLGPLRIEDLGRRPDARLIHVNQRRRSE